ncbi:MAG: S9 family peptidase, partial [Marinilabiliales bacterium]
MRKVIQVSLLVATVVFYSCTQTEMKKESKTQEKLNYPVAHKVDTVDKYFGVEVPDPYRWMENDTTKEVADWVKKQNELTFGYLEKIPFRDSIKARLTELWDFEKESAPFKRGGKYFYYRNDGLQNQSILYVKDSLNGEAKVFIDPNKLSDDGTVSLAGMGFSTDGKKMAYSIARGGSDWNEIFVKDVETGELLSDHIEWVKFSSIAWFKDGFFYSRYDKPVEGKELSNKNEYHKIYYHVIGDSQSEDKLVFENPDVPLRTYYSMVTEDEKYLVIYESGTTHGNALLFKELDKGIDSELYTVVEEFTHEFSVIGNIGTDFYIKTNLDAPRYKLVKLNLDDITKPEWEDVIPQNENVLGSCGVMGGKLFVSYMKDAHSVASVFDLDGKKLYDVELPGIGSLGSVSGKTDESEVFYSFSSFTIPSCVYRYDIETNQSEKIFEPSIDIDLSQYETKQVFYKSKDGTEIPMFICYKKGIELNGDNPTLLYGYGGFNISLTP